MAPRRPPTSPSSVPPPPPLTSFHEAHLGPLRTDVWTRGEASEERLRALAVGGWYAAEAGAPHDRLDLAVTAPAPDGTSPRREEALDSLTGSWGVTSEEEALATVARLHAGMHDDLYCLVQPLVAQALITPVRRTGQREEGPEAEHREMLRHLASMRGLPSVDAHVRYYDAWLQAQRMGLTSRLHVQMPPDIRAWDLARAAHVVRTGVTAGLVGEEMAWDQLGRGLERAREHYGTWRQFSVAFLAGYAFWQSFTDLSVLRRELDRRLNTVQRLLDRPASPWRRVALHEGAPVNRPTRSQG